MKKNLLTVLLFSATVSFGQTINIRTAGSVLTTPKGNNQSVVIGGGSGNALLSSASNATAAQSVFVGYLTGTGTTGADNTFVGWGSGVSNTTGVYNTFFGRSAGNSITNGSYNTMVGPLTGLYTSGGYNTFLGFGTGQNITTGGANVCLGHQAGPVVGNGAINGQLFIDSATTNSPLIWGDFGSDLLKFNGKVGIGGNSATGFGIFPTTSGASSVSSYKLFVEGGILAEEVRVSLKSTWADYVFNTDYNLKTIDALEAFIAENGHLPNVPKAAIVEADGINIAEMARIQMEKIEELTLYIIELNKKIEALESKLQTR
uniref:hypothetical protein n=1 Tax=Flavobacterium sp. TaxID=239 RepID=UPI004049BFE9